MRTFRIQKATHWHEPFREDKLVSSLQRVGANPEHVRAVLQRLRGRLHSGLTTDDLALGVSSELGRLDQRVAARYRLRRAIMELGPEGYPFERYVAKIFDHYGYATLVGQHVAGRCISHEVDVIAERAGRRLMVECKYHNRRGVQSDAKVAMYTWARFEDIRDRGAAGHGGGHAFDEGWLVTNTKVTSDALNFARCVGLKVLGWGYPAEAGLQRLIEAAALYPITCLPRLSGIQRRVLLQRDVLLCRQLAGQPEVLRKLGFSPGAAAQLALDAQQIVQPTLDEPAPPTL
ncbi:MAG: ATP-cone domain-containing protein [Parcubacteria group bacterium Gr01-1014_31]|nr:MAG: ATP-cone domain-containing protein [Parcubacteria group bacterium Gr01-1014_31]